MSEFVTHAAIVTYAVVGTGATWCVYYVWPRSGQPVDRQFMGMVVAAIAMPTVILCGVVSGLGAWKFWVRGGGPVDVGDAPWAVVGGVGFSVLCTLVVVLTGRVRRRRILRRLVEYADEVEARGEHQCR